MGQQHLASPSTFGSPPRGGSGLAAEDESPSIFQDVVAVQVKPVGRETFQAALTVRLQPDDLAHPRSLLLELTDEADLLFYHSLVLGEGDFHTLKSEQRLRVDFQGFPQQVAELLRRCCILSSAAGATTLNTSSCIGVAAPEEGSARMLACLECSASGEGLFSIIEANRFRELTHIALRLWQGTDKTVNRHLAGKLRASKAEASDLAGRLRTSEESLEQAQRQVDELATRARVIAEERTNLERSLEATHQRELAELRQEHARLMGEQQRTSADERARVEADLRTQLVETQERASAAERLGEERQQQLQALAASSKSCQERLQAMEVQQQEARRDLQSLREERKQAELLKFQQERQLGESKLQTTSLQEQLASKEQLASSQSAQVEQAASQRRSLEEMLTSCRRQVQELEERFALASQEITKGNQIIQELHTGKKQVQAKLKLKAAELAQQERAVMELEKAGQMSKHVLGDREEEMGRIKDREARLQDDVNEFKKKLADAHEVLKSNQDVIEYLNKQLTERDLRAIPTLPRPALEGDFRGGGSATATAAGAGGSSLADLLRRAEDAGRHLLSSGGQCTALPSSASPPTSQLGTASFLSPGLATPSSFGASGTGAAAAAALVARMPGLALRSPAPHASPLPPSAATTPDRRPGGWDGGAGIGMMAVGVGGAEYAMAGGGARVASPHLGAASAPGIDFLHGPVTYRRPGCLAKDMLGVAAQIQA